MGILENLKESVELCCMAKKKIGLDFLLWALVVAVRAAAPPWHMAQACRSPGAGSYLHQ